MILQGPVTTFFLSTLRYYNGKNGGLAHKQQRESSEISYFSFFLSQ